MGAERGLLTLLLASAAWAAGDKQVGRGVDPAPAGAAMGDSR